MLEVVRSAEHGVDLLDTSLSRFNSSGEPSLPFLQSSPDSPGVATLGR